MDKKESVADVQARRLRKGPKRLDAKAVVNGEGQFVTLTLTAEFAKALLAELRHVPRTPGVVDVGAALVEQLIALKGKPERLKYMVPETQRTPFMGDGGMDPGDGTVF